MRFYRLQSLFISMKMFMVLKNVAMTLLAPTESVMTCDHNIIYDMTLSKGNNLRHIIDVVNT